MVLLVAVVVVVVGVTLHFMHLEKICYNSEIYIYIWLLLLVLRKKKTSRLHLIVRFSFLVFFCCYFFGENMQWMWERVGFLRSRHAKVAEWTDSLLRSLAVFKVECAADSAASVRQTSATAAAAAIPFPLPGRQGAAVLFGLVVWLVTYPYTIHHPLCMCVCLCVCIFKGTGNGATTIAAATTTTVKISHFSIAVRHTHTHTHIHPLSLLGKSARERERAKESLSKGVRSFVLFLLLPLPCYLWPK